MVEPRAGRCGVLYFAALRMLRWEGASVSSEGLGCCFPRGGLLPAAIPGCRLAGRACCGCASEGSAAIYPGFRFPGRPLFPVARIPGVPLPLVPELRTFRAWLPAAVRNCCLAHVRCPLFVAGREDAIPDRDADLVGIPLRRAVERVGVFGLYGAVGYMSTWPSKLYPL